MPVTKRLRFEILRRDGHTCRYCGAGTENQLTVDHVIPVALGGSDDPDNLVACCKDCNAGKSSTQPDSPLVADVEADALRWARAIALASQMLRIRTEEMDAVENDFTEAWNIWHIEPSGNPLPLPSDYRDSLEVWIKQGLTVADLLDGIDIAMRKRNLRADAVWRYFAGVMWRRLDEIQNDARRLIANDDF